MRGERILVVEESTACAELVAEAGGKVIHASFENALDELDEYAADALVVDGGTLPDIAFLRELCARTSCDVIAVVPTLEPKHVGALYGAGVRAVVLPEHLASALQTSVGLEAHDAASFFEHARLVNTSAGRRTELPRAVCEAAAQALLAEDCAILLPDGKGGLNVGHTSGSLPQLFRQAHSALLERVAAQVAQDRKATLIQREVGTHSSIVYPLGGDERLEGVLLVNKAAAARPFTRRDLVRAGVFATQAQLALENVRLLGHVATNERFASMGQLAAGVAHEINNPLAYVMSNIEQAAAETRTLIDDLERLEDPQVRRDLAARQDFLRDIPTALDDARQGALRIRDIVLDMRNMGRLDERKADFNLSEALRSARRIAEVHLKRIREVTVSIPPELVICGSAGLLSQVFVNLMVNAAQAFAEPVRRDAAIRMRAYVDGAWAVVEVTDNAAGISPEHLPRLFEPLFSTKGEKGTGLGLWLSRQIVSRHGGEMFVESKVGEGTTFSVVLPTAAVSAGILPPRPQAQAASDAKSLRVLFVDDEALILRSYERAFRRNFDVTLVNGGQAALQFLEQGGRADVVVSDVVMPTVGGLQLYQGALRARPELGERFIFVTGSGGVDADALISMDRPLLEKPFNYDKLRDLVFEIAERRTSS